MERWETAIEDYETLITETPGDEEVGRALFEVKVELKKARGEDIENTKLGSNLVSINSNEQFRQFIASAGMSVVLFCNEEKQSTVLEQICKRFPSVSFLKGLIAAVQAIFPTAFHRFCKRHIYANFKIAYPGILLKFSFWGAAKAFNNHLWGLHMDSLRALSADVEAHMHQFHVGNWVHHAYNTTAKVDYVTNNAAESFNDWIRDYRGKPIQKLIDNLLIIIMESYAKKRRAANDWNDSVTPWTRKRLNTNIVDGRKCTLKPASDNIFQVIDKTHKYVVTLSARTCSCGECQISGIPFRHVACCMGHTRGNLKDLCHEYYTVEAYERTYISIIYPLPEADLAPGVGQEIILPPPYKRHPGKPQINRRRGGDEPGARGRSSTNLCSNCSEPGHNKQRCKKSPVVKNKKQRVEQLGAQIPRSVQQTRGTVPRRGRGRPRGNVRRGTFHVVGGHPISVAFSSQAGTSSRSRAGRGRSGQGRAGRGGSNLSSAGRGGAGRGTGGQSVGWLESQKNCNLPLFQFYVNILW